MSTSTKAQLEFERQMSSFTSKRLNSSFRGTTAKFILSWSDDAREHKEMAPDDAHFPDPVKKAMLKNAIDEIKTITDIKVPSLKPM